jgi:hypothetical protein
MEDINGGDWDCVAWIYLIDRSYESIERVVGVARGKNGGYANEE